MRGLSAIDLKARLTGVIAFSPTPFAADGELDTRALAEHVDFLAASKVSAIVICGGVGEFYSLERSEYVECIRTAAKAAAHRLPVLAGIGHSTRIAVHLATAAFEAGVDGLMINPFYFVRPDLQGVVAHYREIAAAVDLGIVIYTVPQAPYSLDEVQRICNIDAVIALKDESGDLANFKDCVSNIGDRLRWISGMAEQECAEYVTAGAEAMTSGLVNLHPQFTLDVWSAVQVGDKELANKMLTARAGHLLEFRARRPSLHTAVIKDGLALLGRPVGDVRLPLLPLSAAENEELRSALVEAKFPVTAAS